MSNKLEHTPGPWKFGKKIAYGHDILQDCEGHVWIGNVNSTGKRSKTEAKANARLIATAPEMIDALIETEKKNYKTWQAVGNPMIPEYRYLNKEIIEKATGKKIEEVMK